MMSEQTAVARASARDIATLPIAEAIEAFAPNFAAVLPPTVPLDHFKRMVVTAINTNPELMLADRRTLFNACVKCASDGLLPDGREAALVVFRTKVKDQHGQERYIDAVQYLSMIAGIRKRLRNAGEVASADAFVVYRRDKFSYRLGDNPFIEHVPAPLDEDAGEEIGAYAIIRLTNGEVLRDVMRKSEIEKARAQSRAPNSLMWTKFKGEGYKKTVLRRCAKAAPQAATLEKLLARDDDLPELPPPEALPAVPPPPQRADFLPHSESEVLPPLFPLVDIDGEIIDHGDPYLALEGFAEQMRGQAKARGEDGLEGIWESNATLISAFREAGRGDLAEQAHALHDDMKTELAGMARRKAKKPVEAPEAGEAPRAGKTASPAAAAAAAPRVPAITNPLDQYEAIMDALRDVPTNGRGDFAAVNYRVVESLKISAPALYEKVREALALPGGPQ